MSVRDELRPILLARFHTIQALKKRLDNADGLDAYELVLASSAIEGELNKCISAIIATFTGRITEDMVWKFVVERAAKRGILATDKTRRELKPFYNDFANAIKKELRG